MHDDNGIGGIPEPVEAVVHHENCATLVLEFNEGLRERSGCFRIEVGARFVKNEDLGAESQNVG